MIRAWAVVAYVAFLSVFALVADFAGPTRALASIDAGRASAHAIAIDLALIVQFGLVHSAMAREAFKRQWKRIVPAVAERSTYVAIASAQLALLVWQWRPIDTVVWSVATPVARDAIWAVQVAGLVVIVLATFLTDHFDLLGLRQAWLRDRYTPVPFVERGLYRYVRHPMMLGFLVWLWAVPTMTVGHLVFAAGLSAYIAIGVALEERSLVRALGAPYIDYRRRVPALLPFTGPSPGSYPRADRRRTP